MNHFQSVSNDKTLIETFYTFAITTVFPGMKFVMFNAFTNEWNATFCSTPPSSEKLHTQIVYILFHLVFVVRKTVYCSQPKNT